MDRLVLFGVLLALFVTIASGCLIVSGKTVHESGTRITDATLNQVRLGETTESWLVATLGKPTECREVEDWNGVRIYRYDHCRTRAEGGAVFLIFAGGSETTTTTSTYFEVTDGVVTRVWCETA